MSSPLCPYCRATLAKMPQRKTRCPACGEPIHVKRAPGKEEKTLVTARRAEEIEAEWAQHHTGSHWLSTIESYGLSSDAFDAAMDALPGTVPASLRPRETARGLLMQLVQTATARSTQKRAAYNLALLANEAGEPFRSYLVGARQFELLGHQESGVITHVRVLSGKQGSCTACAAMDGRVFAISDALKTMPLPCAGCTWVLHGEQPGFCRCSYLAVFPDDLPGGR